MLKELRRLRIYGPIIVIVFLGLLMMESCHNPRMWGREMVFKATITMQIPKSNYMEREIIVPILALHNITAKEITLDKPVDQWNVYGYLVDSAGNSIDYHEPIGNIAGNLPTIYIPPRSTFYCPLRIDTKRMYQRDDFRNVSTPVARGKFFFFVNLKQDAVTITSDTVSLTVGPAGEEDLAYDRQIEKWYRRNDTSATGIADSLLRSHPSHPYNARIFESLVRNIAQNSKNQSNLPILKTVCTNFAAQFPNSGFVFESLNYFVFGLESAQGSQFKKGEDLHKQTIQALLDFKASTKDTIMQHFIDQELQ